jgi:hypothetical protein
MFADFIVETQAARRRSDYEPPSIRFSNEDGELIFKLAATLARAKLSQQLSKASQDCPRK